jgi:hypothetical protein
MLPSKELVSTVLGKTLKNVVFDLTTIHHNIRSDVKKTEFVAYYDMSWHIINIHEFATNCKNWALCQGYQLKTYYQCNGLEEWYIGKCGFEWDAFKCDSIFEACKWILDNKEIK